MSPPRAGLITVVHALEHGVAGEQHPLLLEEEAQVVRRVAGRVQHLEPELGALDRCRPSPMVRSGTTSPASLSGLRLEKASTSAPVCLRPAARCPASGRDACGSAAPSAHARASTPPTIASMWPASSGPGSMTATSSMPTRYVLVPGPVNGPGFGRDDPAHQGRERARGRRASGRARQPLPGRALVNAAWSSASRSRSASSSHVESEHPALAAVDAAHRPGSRRATRRRRRRTARPTSRTRRVTAAHGRSGR